MHPLRRRVGGLSTMVLGTLALVSMLVLPMVTAQTPLCPSVVVSAYARPRSARKAGQSFTVYAKVRTTGTTPVNDVGLRMTVPFSASYPRQKQFGGSNSLGL